MIKHREHRGAPSTATPAAGGQARRGNDDLAGPPPLSRPKKIVFAVVATVLFFAFCEGILWLAGVKTDLEVTDRYAGFVSHVPHFVARSQLGGATSMEVAPHKKSVLNAVSFPREKPPNTFRIVCLGGSTTFGRPFFDETSFPGWLRLWLPAAAPSQKWEVINAGAISYASYRVAGLMEELAKYEPDLFIIYVGQNEFLERRTYDDLLRQPVWFREVTALTGHTRTATLVRQALEGVGAISTATATQPVLGAEVKSIPIDAVGPEAYHRDDALRDEVVDHFAASLHRMLSIAENAGARVMLVVPASNLADFAPFKSEPSSDFCPTAQRQWRQHFAQALKLTQQAQFHQALAELEQAAAIDDRRADLHFARGQLLMGLQRYDEAAPALRRAKDEDICPLRAIEPMAAAVRHAADSPNVLSVDFEHVLSQRAPHGIPGKTQFHDHVHPTIESNRLLASAIIEQMSAAGLAEVVPNWKPQLAAELAARYEMQSDRQRMARELLRLASLLHGLKQEVMATEQLQMALELAGQSSEIMDAAGKLLDQVAGGRATLNVWQQYVATHPDSATGHCRLGVALLKRQKVDAALSAFDAALALDPDSQPALHFAGVLNAESGNLAIAEKHFRRLVLVAPQLATAHANLALAMAKQGRHPEALAHYEQALELDPRSASAHRNAALTYEQLGRTADARRHQDIADRLESQALESQPNRGATTNPLSP